MQKKIRKYRPNVCRLCLNQAFGFHPRLHKADCVYLYYMQICPSCGEMKRIVVGLSLLGKLKMLLALPRR